MNPDISYIVSAYNSEQFLPSCIENLQKQSHRNIEIIVVDSCSTDRTLEIAESYAGKDNRVHIVVQPERTPYGVSWLEGWRVAHSKIVGNSNTDDRSYPYRTTKVLAAYNEGSIGGQKYFYYGGYETRRNGVCVAKGYPPQFSVDDMSQFFRCGVHVHWDNSIRHIADWDKMINAGFEYKSAFDYWLVLYFMSLGVKGFPISSCFSIYNQRNDSLEQADKERNTFESIRAICEFFPGGKVHHDLETDTRVKSPEFYERYQEFLNSYV